MCVKGVCVLAADGEKWQVQDSLEMGIAIILIKLSDA